MSKPPSRLIQDLRAAITARGFLTDADRAALLQLLADTPPPNPTLILQHIQSSWHQQEPPDEYHKPFDPAALRKRAQLARWRALLKRQYRRSKP